MIEVKTCREIVAPKLVEAGSGAAESDSGEAVERFVSIKVPTHA